ncbi:MAG: ogr/Delta-like zinc finger family protein [Salinisphaeraceae bacterium]
MSSRRADPMSRVRMNCPHCGEAAKIRSSQLLSRTYREGYLDCQSPDCGWRGKFSFALTATLAPSERPNPAVHLPLSPRIAAQLRAETEGPNPETGQ